MMMKNVGITKIEMIFCKEPEVFLLGNQLSNLKNLWKKEIPLKKKSGSIKRDFKSLFLDFKANKSTEVRIAQNEIKSPYQAKATLEKIEVAKRIRKVFVLFSSGVLKSKSKAYAIPKIPRLSPRFSP